MRETAGRTAATAARCKNCRRGGFIWCLVGELRRVRGGAWVLVLSAACVGRYVKPQLNIGNCECRELCRFLDAGTAFPLRRLYNGSVHPQHHHCARTAIAATRTVTPLLIQRRSCACLARKAACRGAVRGI